MRGVPDKSHFLVAKDAIELVVGREGSPEVVDAESLELALADLLYFMLQLGILGPEFLDLLLQLRDLAVLIAELLLDACLEWIAKIASTSLECSARMALRCWDTWQKPQLTTTSSHFSWC